MLPESRRQVGPGDMAELGAYLGKSTVLIGAYLQDDETFTVIDLFESPADDANNQVEHDTSYSALTQQKFEQHYRAVHGRLPTVIRGFSETIVDHARHGTHRFVHIDASHHYAHVVQDIAAARVLLDPAGIVVFDDYRALHTPGVSAAVWEARTQGLHLVAASDSKLYGTFGDPEPYREVVREWATRNRHGCQDEMIGSDTLTLVWPVTGRSVIARSFVPPIAVPLAKRLRNDGARALARWRGAAR